MKILQTVQDAMRLNKIVRTLFAAGLSPILQKIGVCWCVGWWCRIKCWVRRKTCSQQNLPEQLREAFEKLGPTFMKLGQVLSMRPDVIPEEFIQEFKKLQDKAPEFSYAEAQEVIKVDFKKPMSKIFKSFEKTPVASASLGQVYIAYLMTGEKVAVKVQRPHIRKTIEQDIRILFWLLERLERHLPELKHYRPRKMIETFVKSLHHELDYEVEGRNADRFAYNFKKLKGIHIPKIYWKQTKKRVLTMEFIEGIRMGDLEEMKRKKIDHHKLMKNCTRGCLLPIFKFGFFHADPHPGNVWTLKNHTICYLDFGMVGVLSDRVRRNLLLHLLFLTQEEVESSLYYLGELVETDEKADLEGFLEEARSLMISFLQNEEESSISQIFYEIVSSGVEYRVYFPPELIMLAKALVTGESMCRLTHPNFDVLKTSRPILEKVAEEEFSLKAMMKSLQKLGPQMIIKMQELPQIIVDEYLKKG